MEIAVALVGILAATLTWLLSKLDQRNQGSLLERDMALLEKARVLQDPEVVSKLTALVRGEAGRLELRANPARRTWAWRLHRLSLVLIVLGSLSGFFWVFVLLYLRWILDLWVASGLTPKEVPTWWQAAADGVGGLIGSSLVYSVIIVSAGATLFLLSDILRMTQKDSRSAVRETALHGQVVPEEALEEAPPKRLVRFRGKRRAGRRS